MRIECLTLGDEQNLEEIELTPTKAICVGRNYRDHAKELGNEVPTEPLIFMKPASAIVSHNAAICRPRGFSRVDYEGELALVIGERAKNLTPDTALNHVLGFTCANDVTVRDLQEKGPWLRAKGMDTFLPIGPRIVRNLDFSKLDISVRVNGETRQSSDTSHLIFGIVELLCFITKDITLMPHDLVLTGTPAGVGNLAVGDEVEVEISSIGILRNPVLSAE